jgi:hypothetical protein
MKILKQSFVNRLCTFQSFLLTFFTVALFTVATSRTQAQIVTLVNNNSSADINISGPGAGATSWLVDGVNQLYFQQFYYRMGNVGGELPVSALSAPTFSTPNAGRLDVSWSDGSFSTAVRYVLTGNAFGSTSSGLSETITLQNLTANTIDLHFFQYSDFDIQGLPLGQSVQFFTNGLGQFNKVIQTDGTVGLTETVTSAAFPIAHVEAGDYPSTFSSLTDGLPTTLNDNTQIGSIGGQVDCTFATQWDLPIGPNGTVIISKLMSVAPEPSSVTLISLGVLGFGLLRRRSRKSQQ